MNEMSADHSVMFRAGVAASQRGWADPVLTGIERLPEEEPTGPPLVIVTTVSQFTVDSARLVASLAGSGRAVLVVLDGEPAEDVARWLPPDILDYPGRDQQDKAATIAEQAAPSDAAISGESPDDIGSAGFPRFCRFTSSEVLAQFTPQVLGPAGQAFQRFRAEYSLSLAEQPGALFAGQWAIDDLGHPAVVWLQPGELSGRPTVLVGATLGVLSGWSQNFPPRTEDLDAVFSDEVIRWAEQPEAGAMITRVMGGFAGDPSPIGDPVSERECYPEAPAADLPERILLTEPSAGFQRVFVSPGQFVDVPTGPADAGLVLIYRVPVYTDYNTFKEVVATVVDSLVRVLRLLYFAGHDLDGRRDPSRGPLLHSLLNSVGFTSGLTLAIGPPG